MCPSVRLLTCLPMQFRAQRRFPASTTTLKPLYQQVQPQKAFPINSPSPQGVGDSRGQKITQGFDQIRILGLDHDPGQGFGAGISQKDPPPAV